MSERVEPDALSPQAQRIHAALDGVRKNLLDLTLRNRLLNYRPSKVRGIVVTDEDGGQVSRRLVGDGRPMSFTGVPDRKKDGSDTETVPVAPVIDVTDDKLNTRYEASALQDRLLRTWSDARTVLEEQGINTLFLAIGMLEWIESADSERVLRAPLLLVPVALERGERGGFRLRWSGEDLGVNLSLAVKVKEEFGLHWPELPDADEIDVGTYLDAVAHAITGQHRWVVQRDAMVVDFFSYAKYLMFKDLDPSRWPNGRKPHEHSVVGGLLSDGIGRDEPPSPDPAPLDDHRPPESAFEVCDADSSQTLVLIDVASGKHMVVEGPPGTGKSQTIANVLAEAVANGKTVLFVAEKMAALEVVKRRLDQYRLGDACLELHSHKTRKRELLQELGRTLNLGRVQLQGVTEHAADLLETRKRLNDYAADLHRAVDPSGWTPFEAQGELARMTLAADLPPHGKPEELAGLKRDEFEARRRSVRNLQAKIREIGTPNLHPFVGCAPEDFLPGDVPALAALLSEARDLVDQLHKSTLELASRLNVDDSSTARAAFGLASAADLIVAAPRVVFDLNVPDQRWRTSADEILVALRAGVLRDGLRDSYAATLRDDSWGAEVELLITDLELGGGRWSRLLRPSFYRSRSRLKALCRGSIPDAHEERKALAFAIRDEAECTRRIRANDPLLSAVCGIVWKGLASPFVPLLSAGEWTVKFHDSIASGDIPPTSLRFFQGNRSIEGLEDSAAVVRKDIASMAAVCRKLFGKLRPFPQALALPAAPVMIDADRIEFDQLASWLANMGADPGRVLEIVAYNRLRDICVAVGLISFCAIADTWAGAGERLEDAIIQVWCEMVVRQAIKERPALARFERVSHENLMREFQRLDREMIEVNRERVRSRHRDKLPSSTGAGATGILREQINLNRRHKPIRWLMRECAGPIQALKPVFMMSPFSVAMFLPPDGPRFDLVVFDEASQVRPEDSIGALLRGDQAVVVGDSHQLPPTNFFEHTLADADGDDDEETVDPHVGAGEMESILSLMRARGADVRDLQWHYRSKYASLIRVSGHAFYPKLQVFPSPEETAANVGLKLNHLPETVYGRGNTRVNLEEAKAVARAVQNHARTCPNLTLGVAAFSVAQQMAILRQLELLQREDAVLDAFGAAHPNEPLFVKNLENVQGDERDVIFISVGYGRDAERRMTLNFGPLNQEGGERRLNVLISRARQRCEVFSNFTADDLAPPANAPQGLKLLKTYLKFAACGELDVPSASGRAPDSPFEEAVSEFLTRAGNNVEPQVGSAGYFIDLAVVDPDRPGRYLLGIECDGATYHSARTARDRDRLREQVLLSKGWLIHRIWSTSWFHENEAERRRLLSAIQTARMSGGTPTAARNPVAMPYKSGVSVQTALVSPGGTSLTVPYATAQVALNLQGKDLHEVWVGTLAETVAKVVAVESPVHIEEVIRRIRSGVSVQRAGNRIRDAFDLAIRHAAQRQTIVVRGKFLWLPGMTVPPVRDRSGLSDGGRNLEAIAPEEIQQLIFGVVRGSFQIRRDELAGEVVRLFGFARITADMRERVDGELSQLIKDRRLKLDGDLIRMASSQEDGRA